MTDALGESALYLARNPPSFDPRAANVVRFPAIASIMEAAINLFLGSMLTRALPLDWLAEAFIGSGSSLFCSPSFGFVRSTRGVALQVNHSLVPVVFVTQRTLGRWIYA